MDKDKMIKDMEKEIGEALRNAIKDNAPNYSWTISYADMAKSLYNAGYQKIPEGSVVLSKEEYEALKAESKEIMKAYQEMGRFYDEACEELETTRKQAVKEFIQAINKEYELFDDVDEIFFSCLREDIKRIAKEFGVEL